MDTKPYIRNSNTHTPAQVAIEELDNKILDFINTTVIPKLVEDRQLTDDEFKKLNHILYHAIALDVYTKKNIDLFRVLSGNKNEKTFNIFSKKMTKNLEKALSLVSCDDIFLGIIKGVNTSSKYAKKYHSIKKQKGIVKLFEKSIIHSLEKLACHKDLKSIFQGSHHVKTVLKLREYILQGGKIENLNIDSTSFANLVQQVEDLKGNFCRNNQYLTFVRNEDDTLSYQQASGKKKEMTGREESHIQKNYLAACRAEDFFMASQLISLYSEKLGNLIKEYVPQPENSIEDTISTKITQLFQRKEYERIARTIAEEWGPLYVYDHGGLKNTVRDFENFLATMNNEMMQNGNMHHTTEEDYTQYIEKYYISKIKQQEAEAKKQREILQMTPKDVQEKLDEINLKWGVPLGFSILGGTLSSVGALSILPFPISLSAIGAIGGVTATGVLYSIGKKISLENDTRYWENVKTTIEQNEKSISQNDEKQNPPSPIRRRRRRNTMEHVQDDNNR